MNRRPPAPEAGSLTMLTYAPTMRHPAGFPFPSKQSQTPLQNCNGQGFEEFLNKTLYSKKDVKYMLAKSEEYKDVLISGNTSTLLTLTRDVSRNTMRALSLLAKYNGMNYQWKTIMSNYGLKWKKEVDDFAFFEKDDIGKMIECVKEMIKILPQTCANTILYTTLVGLRASESCESIRLIKANTNDYYNEQFGILEHFKHKQFVRRTKKAFISVVDQDILDIARNSCETYNVIQLRLKRLGKPCKFKYGRRIYATYLRDNGIPSEVIDVFQGRTPQTVFSRHYYSPDMVKYCTRIRDLITQLRTEIMGKTRTVSSDTQGALGTQTKESTAFLSAPLLSQWVSQHPTE